MRPIIAIVLVSLAAVASAAPVDDLPPGGLVGASWVTNVAADQFAGLSVYRVIPGKVGWFCEFKFGRGYSESDDYYDNISISEAEGWGDVLRDTDDVHDSYSVGMTYALTRAWFIYGGGGITHSANYRQYYDPFHILGDNGEYWVDGVGGGSEFMLLGGAMLRVSRAVLVQAGYSNRPAGLNLGVGFTTSWPF